MTVKDLISKLQELDQNKEICINYELGYHDIESIEEYPENYYGQHNNAFYYIK